MLRDTAKTYKPFEEWGVPKSRPIVGASKGHPTPLGDLLSDMVEPMSRLKTGTQFTEEALRNVSDANLRLDEGRVTDIALGSMDLVVLYPSLDQEESARIVTEEILDSDITHKGVD